MTAPAPQLAFLDPLEPRTLPSSGRAFWTLNTKPAFGPMRQELKRLSDMEWILRNVNRNLDTFMSQGFFNRPCRRALHLSWLTHGYVDLDLYALPGSIGSYRNDPAWIRKHIAPLILEYCDDEGIPIPSLIIFSGRGIYLKWCWSCPIPRAAAGKAIAVNRALVRRFAEWGADPACVDVSRILRVVGTKNTKSGERTEILWQAERDGTPLTYNFELFADEVLRFTSAEIRGFREAAQACTADVSILAQHRSERAAKKRAARRRGAFVPENWHWGVTEDIRWLANSRWGGIVPPGHRDIFGHLAACQLARVITAGQLWPEILTLGRLFLPSDYVNGPEFRQHSSTLLANAKRAAAGQKVEFNGRLYSPVYTYNRQTLIDRLKIEPAEMPYMTRLIDRAEHDRRQTEARRAKGMVERAEYEARAAGRRLQVAEMRASGQTFRAIAAELGISKTEAERLHRMTPR